MYPRNSALKNKHRSLDSDKRTIERRDNSERNQERRALGSPDRNGTWRDARLNLHFRFIFNGSSLDFRYYCVGGSDCTNISRFGLFVVLIFPDLYIAPARYENKRPVIIRQCHSDSVTLFRLCNRDGAVRLLNQLHTVIAGRPRYNNKK